MPENNMTLYNKVRKVPCEAQKPITGGRRKDMLDINPMWRVQTLTEQFGPVGKGWYTKTISKDVVEGSDGTKIAVVDIELYYRLESGEWSMPIYGTGGAMLVDKETKGLFTSDKAFKKAHTDALSVCCKQLGIGADAYWQDDAGSKYPTQPKPDTTTVIQESPTAKNPPKTATTTSYFPEYRHKSDCISPEEGEKLFSEILRTGNDWEKFLSWCGVDSPCKITVEKAEKAFASLKDKPTVERQITPGEDGYLPF